MYVIDLNLIRTIKKFNMTNTFYLKICNEFGGENFFPWFSNCIYPIKLGFMYLYILEDIKETLQ